MGVFIRERGGEQMLGGREGGKGGNSDETIGELFRVVW